MSHVDDYWLDFTDHYDSSNHKDLSLIPVTRTPGGPQNSPAINNQADLSTPHCHNPNQRRLCSCNEPITK